MILMKKIFYPVLLLLLLLLVTPMTTVNASAAEKTYLNYKGQGDSNKVFRFRMNQYTFYKGESVSVEGMYTSRYDYIAADIKNTSSNKKVAVISKGQLKAVGTGTTTITSTYTLNKKNYSFKTTVKVIATDGSTPKSKLSYELHNGEVWINELTGSVKNLIIPRYIDGYRVTVIVDYAFLETDIKSVLIPEEILYLGENAFKGCKLLESVDIKAKIVEIKDLTFEDCKKLNSVKLPSTVKKIGDEAFYECIKLSSIVGINVETIGNTAFYFCESLTTIPFLNLKSIGETCFAYSGLETVPDLSKLETIGERAFSQCTELKTVGKLNKLKVIDKQAFEGCEALESLGLSDKVTKIGFRALQDCAIAYLKLPDTLLNIEEYSLPDNLVYLEYNPDIKRTGVTNFFDKEFLMVSAINEMQIMDMDSELERIRKVHDWMILNISYGITATYTAATELETNDYAYVALKSGYAFCHGYSVLFKAFMDRLGTECIMVRSYEMNHAWNMVKLDDGYWYHIDVTWDDTGYRNDSVKGRMYYLYLVCTDKKIGENHKGWQEEGVPKANGTKYADYFDHG